MTGASPRPSLARRLALLRLGLDAALGRTARGFVVPYGYRRHVPADAPPSRAIEDLFAACRPRFQDVIGRIDAHAPDLLAIGVDAPAAPRWGQGWFPRLDAAAAYAMIRALAPARIVEVGSGHSTRFLARALADGGIAAELTAIDPDPRAEPGRLDPRPPLAPPVRHLARPVQAAGFEAFRSLRPGDVLFIDSSHVAMPGTDVDWLAARVLPALPDGVVVHFHDILLPDDYPARWRWRGYNEHTVAAALLAGGFEPLFASHYAATRMADEVARTVVGRLPLMADAPEGSLWLRKTVPAVGSMPGDDTEDGGR